MRMKRIISVLAALVLPSWAVAADWQYVTDSHNAVWRVDFSSVANVGPHRKAWIRADYSKPQETAKFPKKNFRSEKALWYFDCNSKLMSTVKVVMYDGEYATGDVVDSSSSKFDRSQLDDVTPDTVGETIFQTVCAPASERARIKAKNAAELAKLLKEIEDTRETKQ